MQNSIIHIPDGKWEFDSEVTNIFEDMLKRSIPQYEVMRQAVVDIAAKYAVKGSHIVDLGCSRGDNIARLLASLGGYYHYVGVDVSKPMLEAARDRFKPYESGIVKIEECDLRQSYPSIKNACTTLSILTLQFTPIEYRQSLVRRIFQSTRKGGVFILVEKILGSTAEVDELMVELYYALKSQNGYSNYEIERKKLSLEGVLVPVTAKWNEEILKGAGFTQVDCFWRWMNFAGWVAIKE